MSTVIAIIVRGLPGPQGSKKFVGVHKGRGVLVESSKKVKPWRAAVKEAAERVLMERLEPWVAIEGAVVVRMMFFLPRPKSAPKRVTQPTKKPDLSKLVRSTEDALTDAGIWADDARIVRIEADKLFANDVTPQGCVIHVTPLPP